MDSTNRKTAYAVVLISAEIDEELAHAIEGDGDLRVEAVVRSADDLHAGADADAVVLALDVDGDLAATTRQVHERLNRPVCALVPWLTPGLRRLAERRAITLIPPDARECALRDAIRAACARPTSSAA